MKLCNFPEYAGAFQPPRLAPTFNFYTHCLGKTHTTVPLCVRRAKHIPLYHCVYAVSCQLFPASTSSLGLLSNMCVSTYILQGCRREKKPTVRLYAASIRNSCECRYIIFLYENKIMKKLPFVTISKKTASKSLYYITDITE